AIGSRASPQWAENPSCRDAACRVSESRPSLIFRHPERVERVEGPCVCLRLLAWISIESTKNAGGLLQRHRLGAHIFPQTLVLQCRAHLRWIILALQVVQQRLALLSEAQLEELDERAGLHAKFGDARRH